MKTDDSAELVILVHGLWLSGIELRCLGRRIERCGFPVRYFRYRSWRGTLDQAAAELRSHAQQQVAGRIHLVGHSLGGVVIARMLEQGKADHLGKIILIGSPQQGSRLAARLDKCALGRLILGPVAREGIIGKRPSSLAEFDPLVIAGTLSFGFARFFGVDTPNDGTVAVAETEVPHARRLTVRTSHMGMLFSKTVARQICGFLKS